MTGRSIGVKREKDPERESRLVHNHKHLSSAAGQTHKQLPYEMAKRSSHTQTPTHKILALTSKNPPVVPNSKTSRLW